MMLRLKIKPNQKTDILEKLNEEWIVRVKAPAIDGKANNRLIEFISEVISIPKSKIEIVKGLTSSYKLISIDSDEEYVKRKLNSFLNK